MQLLVEFEILAEWIFFGFLFFVVHQSRDICFSLCAFPCTLDNQSIASTAVTIRDSECLGKLIENRQNSKLEIGNRRTRPSLFDRTSISAAVRTEMQDMNRTICSARAQDLLLCHAVRWPQYDCWCPSMWIPSNSRMTHLPRHLNAEPVRKISLNINLFSELLDGDSTYNMKRWHHSSIHWNNRSLSLEENHLRQVHIAQPRQLTFDRMA